jgi:selT/selW/selH-like putative selenoprotein
MACCEGDDCCGAKEEVTSLVDHGHDHHGHGHSHDHAKEDCCSSGQCSSGEHEVSHGHGHANKSGLQVAIQFWSGWGYSRFATALVAFLSDEFGDKLSITKQTYKGPQQGAFEVSVGGELVHSKLTIPGHGKVQSDDELDHLIDAITNKLPK